ncbi:MAG TPA: Imm1 family immunity protein [Pseudolabrys sp.]|nr:Imm1 family immunity protein [Pseudolabrys sp.]
MKKRAYFASENYDGWPEPTEIEDYFLAPPGQEWFYEGGNDTAGFNADGVDGTEHLELGKGRINISLALWGHPKHGVQLFWSKKGGGRNESYSSRGDLNRLRELVHTMQGTPLPIGLFVPFPAAWKAVKEFLETDGALPKSIQWIASRELPPDTFPDPVRPSLKASVRTS